MSLLEIRNEFKQRIKKLEDLTKEIDIPLSNYDNLSKIINKTTFDIAVVGEFSSGKSTIINALIDMDILPTKLQPTTARVTYLSYSDKERIILKEKNGKIFERDLDTEYLKKLIADNPLMIEQIESIEVKLKNQLLSNSIVIIDTPGTNDTDEQRVEITYGILPTVDAVIYVSTHPVTTSNLEVFNQHILNNKINNLFIVLNKIDTLGENLELALKDFKNNFSNILDKQLENFYAVSALDYIEGKEDADEEMIKNSRFELLKEALNNFIISSEKFNNLKVQYNSILEKSKNDTIELIKLKAASLDLSEEEFQERKNKLKQELMAIKDQVRELERQIEREFDKLNLKVQDSLTNLLSEILEMVNDIFNSKNTDLEYLKSQIEKGIKQSYETWMLKNQPFIEKFIETIKEEISIRLASSIQDVSNALSIYNKQNIDIPQKTDKSELYDLLKDDTKSGFISTAAVVAGMFILSTIGTFPPLAFILGPLVQNFRKNLLEKQKEQIKPNVISSIQNNFQNFRNQFIDNLEKQKDFLLEQLNEAFNNQVNRINNIIDDVEKERNLKAIEIQQKIRKYKEIIEQLNKV